MKHMQRATASMVIAPQAISNGATASGTFDTLSVAGQGGYAELSIGISSQASTNCTGVPITLTESDDLTTYTTFNTDFARTLDSGTNAATPVRYLINLPSRKRYLKLTLTAGNGTSSHADDDYVVSCIGYRGDATIESKATNDAGSGILIVG